MTENEFMLYKQAEQIISDKHPMKCVCGRLCTGLHEMNCRAFKKAVEKKYNQLKKVLT